MVRRLILLKKQNLYVYLGDGKEFPRITHADFWMVYLLINLTFLINFSRAVNTVTLFCGSLEQMFSKQEGETKRKYKNHYRFDTEPPSCMGGLMEGEFDKKAVKFMKN